MKLITLASNRTSWEISRSSYWRYSVEKGVLRNFAKFTGSNLCQRLYFNKVAALRPATLYYKRVSGTCSCIKKESLAQVLSCEFSEIFTEHLGTTASESLLLC